MCGETVSGDKLLDHMKERGCFHVTVGEAKTGWAFLSKTEPPHRGHFRLIKDGKSDTVLGIISDQVDGSKFNVGVSIFEFPDSKTKPRSAVVTLRSRTNKIVASCTVNPDGRCLPATQHGIDNMTFLASFNDVWKYAMSFGELGPFKQNSLKQPDANTLGVHLTFNFV
jgi:hypothetical protein